MRETRKGVLATMTEEELFRRLENALSGASTVIAEDGVDLPIKVIERAMNPFGLGEIPEPDGYAYVRADCGDSMEVFLKVKNDRVEEARFDTLGCGPTIACGSMAMELAQGARVTEALRIKPKDVAEALGGLPEAHFHCAELAVETLKKALEDYLSRSKEPWKKLYRPRH
jgi:nitrogen fixation NifU-like protein